jgi:hypothetical protein
MEYDVDNLLGFNYKFRHIYIYIYIYDNILNETSLFKNDVILHRILCKIYVVKGNKNEKI